MLRLVGLGIWDEKDVSIRGIEACMKSQKVYCELYTAAWGGDLKRLEKMIGKNIIKVHRKDVEDHSEKLIEEAKNKRIALLVPGDPLVATTHVHLIEEAKAKGVRFEVVHSSSVYTAVARTGLQLYKFGRTATVITPGRGYESEGFYDAVAGNQKQGLHTLLLLDVDMGTKKALELLKKIDESRDEKILGHVVICSKLGSQDEKIIHGKIDDLMEKDLPHPAAVIVPGNLHFMEKEFIGSL